MLKTKVKVGNITNLSEARYCAGMGVDFLSFPAATVDTKTFQEITGWVAGPKFIIETDSIEKNEYEADYFEHTIDSLEKFSHGKNVFVSLRINEWFEKKVKLLPLKEKIIGIDLHINSIRDSEKIIEQIAKEFDVFINNPLPSDLEFILELPVTGISLNGNAESRPGLKEYPLSEILESLEID
ncbi:MAG: hypothetical protein JST48_03035 [Bacteroidetes bacterium]|nr:hypothetical protein [Bacteroidota bacterium]